MSRILWLASYPKSGNTWLRAFLSNLIEDGPEPTDINALLRSEVASVRAAFDEIAGIESSDLTADEIDALRPSVYRWQAATYGDPLFKKIHDAYTTTAAGEPLVPADATRCAVYVLRNPLDVAISMAHHNGSTLDRAIEFMKGPNSILSGAKGMLQSQLRQKCLSWSAHVESWTDGPPFPVHLLQYEHMFARPTEVFGAAAKFLGLPCDRQRVERAVFRSKFEILAGQERAHGFNERSFRATTNFFRKGRPGAWREVLSTEQVARIVRSHSGVMRRFGYLSDWGEPRESCSEPRDGGEVGSVCGSKVLDDVEH